MLGFKVNVNSEANWGGSYIIPEPKFLAPDFDEMGMLKMPKLKLFILQNGMLVKGLH